MDEEKKEMPQEDFFNDEFGSDRRSRISLDEGYGRRQTDHPIRCLDCNSVKKMFWQKGVLCPVCGSQRFFPMVYVEDLDKATGKSKKTLFENTEKELRKIQYIIKSRYKIWLLYLLVAVNIGVWGRMAILSIAFKSDIKFVWPHFYVCKDCHRYFSRSMQDDVGRARCVKCRSIKVKRIKNMRIAR